MDLLQVLGILSLALLSIGSKISTLSLPVSVHSFNTDGLGVA